MKILFNSVSFILPMIESQQHGFLSLLSRALVENVINMYQSDDGADQPSHQDIMLAGYKADRSQVSGDISRHFIGNQDQLFFTGSRTTLRRFCADQNSYFKPNHDVSLTLIELFLCLNLSRTLQEIMRRDKKKTLNKCFKCVHFMI